MKTEKRSENQGSNGLDCCKDTIARESLAPEASSNYCIPSVLFPYIAHAHSSDSRDAPANVYI